MNFTVKAFAELSPAKLHAIYTARVAVFVVEQACPYQEVDAQDLTALHIFAEQNGKWLATRDSRDFYDVLNEALSAASGEAVKIAEL